MMACVAWRDAFRVGVEEIDTQHQQLFAILARLDQEVASESSGNLAITINALVAYLKEHFSREEALLASHPQWQEHHRLHWQFTEQVLRFLRDFKRATGPDCLLLAGEIRDFLARWLQDHILRTDRCFFAGSSQPAG